MSNYLFQQNLKRIWEKADVLYKEGKRGTANLFEEEDLNFLHSIGHSAQEAYDFVEDWNNYGGPDFETFLMLAGIRRYYFLHTMKAQQADKIVDTVDLPPKTESVRGIVWLPRLIEKARAKLRGEMSDDLMYGCGGDRDFSMAHEIHLADILQFVMEHFDDTDAIVDFIAVNSKAPIES